MDWQENLFQPKAFFREVTKGRCFICRRGHWNTNLCDNWVMSLHTATMCFWGLEFLFVMADCGQHFHWVISLRSRFSRLSWLFAKGNWKLSVTCENPFCAAVKEGALSIVFARLLLDLQNYLRSCALMLHAFRLLHDMRVHLQIHGCVTSWSIDWELCYFLAAAVHKKSLPLFPVSTTE